MILVSVLIPITLLTFWRVVKFPFVQDDWEVIPAFGKIPMWSIARAAFLPRGHFFYRPLGTLYLAGISRIFGLTPVPFHVVALTLHLVNAFLVFEIAMFFVQDFAFGVLSAIIYAVAVAVHLESLTWAVGIYDIAGSSFFLLSMLLFFRGSVIASACMFALAVLFKESSIVLPIILGAWQFLLSPGQEVTKGRNWRRFTSSTPFLFVLSVYMLIWRQKPSPLNLSHTHPYIISPWGPHLINNTYSYFGWMFQSLFPWKDLHLNSFKAILFLASACGVASTVIMLRKCCQPDLDRILFLAIWTAVALAPVIFLPNHTFRYYAGFSLPAFILLSLILANRLLAEITRSDFVSRLTIIIFSFLTIASSVFQANRAYSSGSEWHAFFDGTNRLVAKARTVEIVRRDLALLLPYPPHGSTIALASVDVSAFGGSEGPRVVWRWFFNNNWNPG